MTDAVHTPAEPLQFFFCIGTQKSGTTILARILDQHPDIACIWESYAYKPHARASILNPDSDSWRKHGFREEDVRQWAGQWQRRPYRLLRRVVRRLTGYDLLGMFYFRQVMPSLLADFAQRNDATVVGDKWPWYIEYLEETRRVFPNARFIYNVRDPRGLWNSAERFKGRERGDEILAEMLAKERVVASYLGEPEFFTLRYEDLICQPERTARALYAFLGCEFDLSYLRYDREKDRYPARWNWIPEASEQLDPWHAFKWKEQVPKEVQRRITKEAKRFIEKYGYD